MLRYAPGAERLSMGLRRQFKKLVRTRAQAKRTQVLTARVAAAARQPAPPPLAPVWPLPRRSERPEHEIRDAFARFPEWHYAFAFDGGLTFDARYRRPPHFPPERPFQRFAHFMPSLSAAAGGLAGKRILDIACNSGFWSLQCALLGAREVVGIDARPELIEQAKLVQRVAGIDQVSFRQLDFWEMTPEVLSGPFDIVLNLGLLYHLAKPLEALERTLRMTTSVVLLDTAIDPSPEPIVRLRWEEPTDIRNAAHAGIVMHPTRASIELMLRHLGVADVRELALRSLDMPPDYLDGRRASWIIRTRAQASAT